MLSSGKIVRLLPFFHLSGSVAQLVEQRPFKPLVVGSIPTRPTIRLGAYGASLMASHAESMPSSLPQFPSAQQAFKWATSAPPVNLPEERYCQTRDTLTARLDRCGKEALAMGMPEQQSYLLRAIIGEIGNNSFDHNLGSWKDIPGSYFYWERNQQQFVVALADRGQGLLTTLRHVRSSITSHEEALKTAFLEKLSGRAPERRGNGLKYVRSILLEDGLDLWFQSGTAVYSVHNRKEEWAILKENVPGCIAILTWQSS